MHTCHGHMYRFLCPGQEKKWGGSKEGPHALAGEQGSMSSPTGIGSRRRVSLMAEAENYINSDSRQFGTCLYGRAERRIKDGVM